MARSSQSARSDQVDADNSTPGQLPDESDYVAPGTQPNTGEHKPDNDNRDEDGFISQPVAEPKKEDGPFLVGRSDDATQRRVTEADFASVGIQQSTLVFEWKNGFRLPLKNINPAAVEFLVEKEYGFSVSDE